MAVTGEMVYTKRIFSIIENRSFCSLSSVNKFENTGDVFSVSSETWAFWKPKEEAF